MWSLCIFQKSSQSGECSHRNRFDHCRKHHQSLVDIGTDSFLVCWCTWLDLPHRTCSSMHQYTHWHHHTCFSHHHHIHPSTCKDSFQLYQSSLHWTGTDQSQRDIHQHFGNKIRLLCNHCHTGKYNHQLCQNRLQLGGMAELAWHTHQYLQIRH